MLNKVFLIGRLTRDPEIRFLPSGSQVTSFSVAVNRSYKVNNEWKEETYFFDVEAFGYLAERLGKQLNKGTQILIEGQLRQDRWETAGGDKRTKVKIVADKVSVLSPKGEKTEKTEEEPDLDIENSIEDFSSDEDVPF
ncbi:single-stranded DNA-binding protein [Persephonella sp.]